MKQLIVIIYFLCAAISASAQLDAGSVMGMPSATTAEITVVTPVNEGALAYSTDEDLIYVFTSSLGWVKTADDQTDSEVNLVTPVDSDGDLANEATVEDVIQAITPITAASGRIFYPPSIEIDASVDVNNATVNLYAQYISQFSSASTIASNGAPATVPTYAADELYYYVTYFDPAVFANIKINNQGEMEYDIIGRPDDFNTLINIVFVVK